MNLDWLVQALQQLSVARRILGCSYVFAYYVFDASSFSEDVTPEQNSINQTLFENLQQQLEAEVRSWQADATIRQGSMVARCPRGKTSWLVEGPERQALNSVAHLQLMGDIGKMASLSSADSQVQIESNLTAL